MASLVKVHRRFARCGPALCIAVLGLTIATSQSQESQPRLERAGQRSDMSAVRSRTVMLAGIAASDPYDGILRGIVEACACLTGFAALGPFIGLWTVAAA